MEFIGKAADRCPDNIIDIQDVFKTCYKQYEKKKAY